MSNIISHQEHLKLAIASIKSVLLYWMVSEVHQRQSGPPFLSISGLNIANFATIIKLKLKLNENASILAIKQTLSLKGTKRRHFQ